MEHRWGERFRINQTVTVRDAKGWTAVARLRDVSISGAFIECRHPFDTASWVTVHFGHGSHSVAVDGFIARWTREGLGIEWSEFAPEVVTELLKTGAVPRRRPLTPPRRPVSARDAGTQAAPDRAPRIPIKPPGVLPAAGSAHRRPGSR
jgi:PilZ domain-containing protein